MRILILGINGLLGSNLYLYLKNYSNYEIYGTCRNMKFNEDNIFCFEHNIKNLKTKINYLEPDIIINCLVKTRFNKKNYTEKIDFLYSNCEIPFFLDNYCYEKSIYFIHFSTDSVFKSDNLYHQKEENYSPENFYGLTKCLSENLEKSLVLRICPIGFELFSNNSLFNFIYNNDSEILYGFENCIFNGTTTIHIAKKIIEIINKKNIYGIRHITGQKINKYYLLKIINNIFELKKTILPKNKPEIIRLIEDDNEYYCESPWDGQIEELKKFMELIRN